MDLHFRKIPILRRIQEHLLLTFIQLLWRSMTLLVGRKAVTRLSQVFYTLGQIPRSQHSQIDRIQLCLVCKETFIKKIWI